MPFLEEDDFLDDRAPLKTAALYLAAYAVPVSFLLAALALMRVFGASA